MLFRAPMKTGVFIACAFLLVAPAGCLNAFDDCPPEERPLAEGGTADGITPEQALAPLLGEHRATVTWLASSQTTTLHLDVTLVATFAVYGCDNSFGGFRYTFGTRLFTDDGLIDVTVTDSSDYFASTNGRPDRDPSWSWSFAVTPFVTAGVAPSSNPDVYDVEMSILTAMLKPLDGVVELVPSVGAKTQLATFHFLN